MFVICVLYTLRKEEKFLLWLLPCSLILLIVYLFFNILQKASQIHRKDGASVRPRSSMLEKAIRELEKMVAECEFPVPF